ncbi:hypothetical protein ACFL5F_08060 [Planctomycetota bacterium]
MLCIGRDVVALYVDLVIIRCRKLAIEAILKEDGLPIGPAI